jgi:nitrite reductase/ring-hydroxylating ferredoxin subunit
MMGATLASGAMHVGCSDDGGGGSTPKNPMAGTNTKEVPVGTLGVLSAGLILGRDAGGLYAMTAICAHQQCDITKFGTIGPDGITCNCHGSTYNTNGVRTGGPAVNSLKHFKVSVGADGTITVDQSMIVDAAVRTPV